MDVNRLSACTFPVKDRSLGEALPVIADAGYTRIDLLGRAPHFTFDEDPATIKELTAQYGIEVANLGTYVGVGFASDNQAEQEAALVEVKQAIDAAVAFGARSIRVFRPHSEIDDPTKIDHVVPWLKQAAAYGAEKNVYLGFENHGGPLCGDPEHCKTLSAKVGSPYFGV
ncbi:MAG: TIM barrel protein, partial [Chloroflexota bacterium]